MENISNMNFIVCIFFMVLFLLSCKHSSIPEETEKTYITINGDRIELVWDEYDNTYMKESISGEGYIYVPYPYEIDKDTIVTKNYAKLDGKEKDNK